MRKRWIRTGIVLLFLLVLGTVVLRTPKLKRTETKSDRTVQDETVLHGETDYTAMSEKELLVLAYDGDAEACYRLGVLYDYGVSPTQQNFTSAMEWYRTADAYGNRKAACAIGYLYLNGCGVAADREAARGYFVRAVNLGDEEGYVGLGRIGLEQGETGEELAGYFQQAKAAGILDGAYYLGYLYEKGIGTRRKPKRAYKLYESVAFSDSSAVEDQFAIHAAMTRLGILCMEGIGTEASQAAAREWFERAAESGYAMAQYYLGILYEMGYGVPVDYNRALTWLEAAAQQDYAPAYNEIGCMYFNGYGVDVNYEEALYYQKLAAALGYEKAQVNLGYLYENGYGVEQDLSAALMYYRMAKETGYAGADEAEARIRARMEGMKEK